MNIYFTAAISRIPDDHQENYKKIVGILEKLGHRVYAKHILGKTKEIIDKQSDKEAMALYKKLITLKNKADLVIAETSYPSFGVGQEISYSIMSNKPVIALHVKGNRPHLLQAIGTEYLYIVEYTKDNLREVLTDYIEYARDMADTRFNFFISPEIEAFLDWISRKNKVPRAVFLRQLIEEDMQKNRKYQKDLGSE